jgi:hypothetical protein
MPTPTGGRFRSASSPRRRASDRAGRGSPPTGAHGGDQAVQRGGVGNDVRGKTDALALRHDRHAVFADAAGNDDPVAGSRPVARVVFAVGNDADAGGGDIDAVALALLTTLVSPVTTGTPAAVAARAIDSTMRARSASGKTFLEDEARPPDRAASRPSPRRR